MSSTERTGVMVGVTGRGRERSVLQYAAECATRDDAEGVLAHGFPVPLASPPLSGLMVDDTWRDVATSVVSAVCEEFEEMTQGTVPCWTVVRARGRRRTSPTHVVVAVSARASCVVLQHRELPASSRTGRRSESTRSPRPCGS